MTMMMLVLASFALAAEPEFEGTEEAGQEAEESETTLSAELGGAWAVGNTDFYTLNAGLTGAHLFSKNKLGLIAGVLTGKGLVDSDGDGTLSDAERDADRVLTSSKYFADARYDRFFGEKNSLYLLGGALADRFAGYDLRTHEQLGYSRLLVSTDSTSLVVEVGLDYAQEQFVDGVDPDYQDVIAGRLMSGFTHTFNDSVSFSETIEVYENILDTEDLRLLNSAAFTAKISDALSLKISNDLTFDNQPVEGFRPMDVKTSVTIVATLL